MNEMITHAYKVGDYQSAIIKSSITMDQANIFYELLKKVCNKINEGDKINETNSSTTDIVNTEKIKS